MSEWWAYENLDSGYPYSWEPATKHDHPDDNRDFHIDLGGGNVPKARLNLDRHKKADIQIDLNTLELLGTKGDVLELRTAEFAHGKVFPGRLPFPDDSIESAISHHCLEHIGTGFINLMDEMYRVLKPGGIFRIIVPLYPSNGAVSDQDHKRYFMPNSFESFCHDAGPEVPHWQEVFAQPYTTARFRKTAHDFTAAQTLAELADENFGNSKRIDLLTLDHIYHQGREQRLTLTK